MAWTVPASTDVLMTGCALFRCDGDQEALSVYALRYAIVSRSNSSRGNEMTTQSSHTSPILVAKGDKVRALVRREDERAEALRQLGAEVMQGDLTDLTAMHRAIEGCTR